MVLKHNQRDPIVAIKVQKNIHKLINVNFLKVFLTKGKCVNQRLNLICLSSNGVFIHDSINREA